MPAFNTAAKVVTVLHLHIFLSVAQFMEIPRMFEDSTYEMQILIQAAVL